MQCTSIYPYTSLWSSIQQQINYFNGSRMLSIDGSHLTNQSELGMQNYRALNSSNLFHSLFYVRVQHCFPLKNFLTCSKPFCIMKLFTYCLILTGPLRHPQNVLRIKIFDRYYCTINIRQHACELHIYAVATILHVQQVIFGKEKWKLWKSAKLKITNLWADVRKEATLP